MISSNGTISIGGQTVGQIQLITNDEGDRRVQLYNSHGLFLCESPFAGDDDVGYEHGLTLYNGYIAGWNNAEYTISKAVSKALNTRNDLQIG